jgi:hypothetical protein
MHLGGVVTERPCFTLTLRDHGAAGDARVELRLRAALKRLLRAYGLRCTSIVEGSIVNVRELAELVRDCRAAQRKYFQSRETLDLEQARRLEVWLDDEVAELLDPRGPGLFGGPREGGAADDRYP